MNNVDEKALLKFDQIPADKKSLTLRVWLGSDKGTLTAQEIDTQMASVIKRLTKSVGAEIRDK